MLWVRIPLKRDVLDTTVCDKVRRWTCDRSVVFFEYSCFLHQLNRLPRYNWNIVESGVKHHNYNPPNSLFLDKHQTSVNFFNENKRIWCCLLNTFYWALIFYLCVWSIWFHFYIMILFHANLYYKSNHNCYYYRDNISFYLQFLQNVIITQTNFSSLRHRWCSWFWPSCLGSFVWLLPNNFQYFEIESS